MQRIKSLLLKYQIIRFIIVGGFASLVHYVTYRVTLSLLDSVDIAYIVGFMVSVTFNFFASNFFTFKTKPSWAKGIKFLSSHLFNLGLEWGLLHLYLYLSIGEKYAPLAVYATAFPISFILVRFSLLGFKRK